MNKKEVLELKRRFKKEAATFTRGVAVTLTEIIIRSVSLEIHF